MNFFKKTKDIGIDFGTSNTSIYIKGKGIVLKEDSVVAINNDTNKIVAVGKKAKAMVGKTPRNMSTINPIISGAIANFDITKDMIKSFLRKVLDKKTYIKRIVVCWPIGLTEVEKRAIEEMGRQHGSKNVTLIEQSMAAAIGVGLPVDKAIGNMIVVIGAGVTEVTVISLGGIVTSNSIRVGGDRFDEEIMNYIKSKYKLQIGKITAENIKVELGSVIKKQEEEKNMNVIGMDLVNGIPKAITIINSEIREVLGDLVEDIIELIKKTLENTQTELVSDILENGIMIVGGGALLVGLDKKIGREINITIHMAENPADCVIIGIGKVLEENLMRYK